MPIDQFKLIFAGQQMEETKKLTDYKIQPGTFIIMVPALRGGWSCIIAKNYFIIYGGVFSFLNITITVRVILRRALEKKILC